MKNRLDFRMKHNPYPETNLARSHAKMKQAVWFSQIIPLHRHVKRKSGICPYLHIGFIEPRFA